MTKADAKGLLVAHLTPYRQRPYPALCALLQASEDIEAEASDGTRYAISVHGYWDSGRPGNLRIQGAIVYSFWTSFLPLSEDFIMSPDGSFLDESTHTAS
jgi:hypothetical protein